MDANMMADGVISLDDRPAIAAIDRVNKGLDGHESKAKTVLDRAGREWQVYGEGVVRVSDRGKTSLDRLLASMEKQAAMAGKSGTDRLIAERDQLIKKWGDEERAVNAITKAYEKMISAESGGGGGKWQQFADNAKNFVEQPMQAIKGAAGGLLETLGPVWTTVGAGAAVLGSVAVAGWEAAKSLAEYGLQIKNAELRTGLTSKEVGQFGFAARMAGQDITIFEKMMRQLSQAADESSKDGEKVRKTLSGMGIDLRSVTGGMKPTAQIMQEIAAGLGKLPEGLQRDAAAIDLFKRAGIEAIPVITGLTENVRRAKELGLGATEEDLKRWEEYHRNITEAEVLWERFTRKIKEPLAAVVTFLFKDQEGRSYSFDELKKRGVNLGEYAPSTPHQVRAAANAAGFSNPERDQWDANIQRDAMLSYAGKVEDRQRADAAVVAYQNSQGLAGQLKKAEDDLSAKTKPAVGVSSLSDVAAYSAAEKHVEALKNQIAAAKKNTQEFDAMLKEAVKHVDELGNGLTTKLMAGIEKLHPHDVNADDFASGLEKNNNILRRFGVSPPPGVALQSIFADSVGTVPGDRKEIEAMDAARERVTSMGVAAIRAELEKQAKQAQQMVGLSGATGVDAIRQAYEIRVNLAKELATVEANRIAADGNAARNLVDTAQAQRDFQKEMDDAHEEALVKQLELQKQQIDTLKKDSEGLWHTLLSNPAKFPKQLASTVHEAVIKPVADGMATVTANVLHPIIYGADGGGGLAGVFKGVFGGKQQDPMKLSTDMNTAVTAQNSAALATLTAIIAGAMGMSAPAVAAPAGIGGISLPSISAPAVAGMAMSSMAFNGGGSSSGFSSAAASSPLAMVSGWSGGGGAVAGSSADVPTMAARATGGGFNPLALLGGQRGAPGNAGAGGWAGMLSNFKSIKLGGVTRAPGTQNYDPDTGDPAGMTPGKITGVNGLAGALMGGGGMMLASAGLMGENRGTWGGIAEGTAGGAMLGYQQGGALGALIGGSAGFAVGAMEKVLGILSPETKAKQMVKQIYGISINDATAKQIASLATQKYGGNVSVAVRDPDVRKMLELYAQGTGQKFPLSAATPRSGSLAESGGNLYQQATYVNGVATTFQSNLPVLGGLGGGNNYPTPGGPNTSAGMGPMSVSLNIGGADAASFLTGQVVTPGYVADASMAAQNASYGRVQASANTQLPGLTTGT